MSASVLIVALAMSPAIIAVSAGLLLGHRKQMAKLRMGMGPAMDQQEMARLNETARRLEQRVITLENVLDSEAPGWRSRSERG